MSKPRLLDLYCRKGGAAMGYIRAGFEVVGVDIEDHADGYPGEFVQADALHYLWEWGRSFDAIHASPPCQNASTLTAGNRKRPGWTDGHVDWIRATRDMLNWASRPYVIENVQGAQLRKDQVLCGLMFDLKVFRHRYFELGYWKAQAPSHPSHRGHRVAGWRHGVRHEGDMFAVYGDGGGKGTIEEWQQAMGIDWMADRKDLAEAIPPAYTEHIGRQLMAHLASEVAA